MTLVQAVMSRLRAETELRQVQGALELAAAIKALSVATPGAFVVPLSDLPAQDEAFTGQTLQRVLSKYSVVLVVDNKRDSTGGAASDELEQLRQAVRTALLGWMPPGFEAPLTAGPGNLIDLDNGRVWWGDEFQIEHYWSSND